MQILGELGSGERSVRITVCHAISRRRRYHHDAHVDLADAVGLTDVESVGIVDPVDGDGRGREQGGCRRGPIEVVVVSGAGDGLDGIFGRVWSFFLVVFFFW